MQLIRAQQAFQKHEATVDKCDRHTSIHDDLLLSKIIAVRLQADQQTEAF